MRVGCDLRVEGGVWKFGSAHPRFAVCEGLLSGGSQGRDLKNGATPFSAARLGAHAAFSATRLGARASFFSFIASAALSALSSARGTLRHRSLGLRVSPLCKPLSHHDDGHHAWLVRLDGGQVCGRLLDMRLDGGQLEVRLGVGLRRERVARKPAFHLRSERAAARAARELDGGQLGGRLLDVGLDGLEVRFDRLGRRVRLGRDGRLGHLRRERVAREPASAVLDGRCSSWAGALFFNPSDQY
mmetsp:Transcript_7978/g.20540  ORF Transcript_7978/g.20540 Transcript_7978/m.20540 type:complete len:243 (-) Transcript_7978:120-848(-)